MLIPSSTKSVALLIKDFQLFFSLVDIDGYPLFKKEEHGIWKVGCFF
jgi:hypothetical protein